MNNHILKYSYLIEDSHKGWEEEALPIGNGCLGAKIFGGVEKERIQLNEKTLWKGGPSVSRPDYKGGNDGTPETLKKIQKALENKDNKTVNILKKKLIGIKDGYGCFLDFANLYLEFSNKEYKNYLRQLNIDNGILNVSYEQNGSKIDREYFASYKDNVIVVSLNSTNKDLSFKLDLELSQEGNVEYKGSEIVATGKVLDNDMQFALKILIRTDGDIKENYIENATFAKLYIFMATNYKDSYPTYRGEDALVKLNKIVDVFCKNEDKVKQRHLEDFNNIICREKLSLTNKEIEKDTNVLLDGYRNNSLSLDEKAQVEELLYVYGKYLILSSSRQGSLPANLQGVWNDSNNPAWGSDYHFNINLQMCYWHVMQTNMKEAFIPLIDYIYNLMEPGKVTAKIYHDIDDGWVAHNQNTPFGWTCPGWDFDWGWSPASSSWILSNLYEYFEYTQDLEMLKEKIYPAMLGNVKFWQKNLLYLKEQDRFVSSPSYSPEHGPVTVGNTFEQEIIYNLFKKTITAAKLLNEDDNLINELIYIKDRLKPLSIGKWGQIKEWTEEDDWYKIALFRKLKYAMHKVQKNHRHASHLLGVYPFYDINEQTPNLFKAAKVSLLDRGKDGNNNPGWSKANKACIYARLKEKENASEIVEKLIKFNIYNNLWDFHPPYQMDGNCGYVAAVNEMLVYDDGNMVELLPACKWRSGDINGMSLKGNMTINFTWENFKVKKVLINSNVDKNINIKVNGKNINIQTNKEINL